MKSLYMDFYNEMANLTMNLVCASCGCIDHRMDNFSTVPTNYPALRLLHVDPSLVPFDFASSIPQLDDLHIMIDPLGVTRPPSSDQFASLLVCYTCKTSLDKGVQPPEALANYRWIGTVPPQLQDLTWIEELLIARAHLTGRIVRLQNRNTASSFGLKGHVILLPQDTTELLNILPRQSSSLPDIVRVVWVGRPVQNVDMLRDHFSVRTQNVYDALRWLVENNEDYKDVTIDQSQFDRWPPVWVPEELLQMAGVLDDGSQEDNARMGVATEDVDTLNIDGDLPITSSGIVDIDRVSQSSMLDTLQHISLWKDDKVINVITGNNILSEENFPSYFTSAFPKIFPWGTGKHIDERRPQDPKKKLSLKRWVQLLLKNSSRCIPISIALMFIRRFQSHRGFVILCYDILRRRHSLSKTNLITSRDTWETTAPLLESLTDEKLTIAANQAAQHKPITDFAVKKLLSMVGSIGSTAPGSEERKSYDLARMKSATVRFGLPLIFITLNPADSVSPVALFYSGEKIDVKNFHPRLFSAAQRLKTMLDNPLAVVEYFRNTIDTVIETMLKGAMFGKLLHYQGPIEYLGRGPPHAHLLVCNSESNVLTFQLWIEGAGSPRSVRDKGKTDLVYRQRLLDYIDHICCQCMPPEAIDESSPEPGHRAFRPMLDPNNPAFDEAMKIDVFDIVRSRQFHNDEHVPGCFKYGSRKCRFRFPKNLVLPKTVFDDSTGVILQKRDREWLNNYNLWFSLIMRTNHDSQFLFSQTEALAKIYYTMKYITKTEETTYSKLTIAAAVAKAVTQSGRHDKGKLMLIRTFNKISSHREVGIPEAISHLLDFPDTLTGAIFENIHTTHLLNYLKKFDAVHDEDELWTTDMGESSIVRVRNRTTLVSLFDDYAHRGPSLADMCLYDYCSLVYKSPISNSRHPGGHPFDSAHPQHTTYRQFVRKNSAAVPTLLGKLLFLRPDSGDEDVRTEHFCILRGVFVPWSYSDPPRKPSDVSWESLVSREMTRLPPRTLRYIDNLALLHKSKEEAHIDQLRLHAQSGDVEGPDDGLDDPFSVHLDMMMPNDEHDVWELEGNNSTRALAIIQSALEGSINSADQYVEEAMEANFANGYFETTPGSPSSIPDVLTTSEIDNKSYHQLFTVIDTKLVGKLLKEAENFEEKSAQTRDNDDIVPGVFLNGSDISSLIQDFSLNAEQALAFRIICNHALGHHLPSEPQLLMGVLGEGGTGKSRLINAIRTWFRLNGRANELIVAATTGSAAVKIRGSTVHSAVSIPIETSDGNKRGKLTPAQLGAWSLRRYMVIDEISMLDCKVMEDLHKQLAIAKANPETSFGGVNILFFGDFLQLPAVLNPDLYVDTKKFGLGHRLWRSLNAVVILKQQMRQAGDPLYGGILSRIRLRIPTDEDIEILRSRIGVQLPNMSSVPAVVRRHTLRHAMNIRRLQEAESTSDTQITYCVAGVSEVSGMSMHEAYQVQFGCKGSDVDAIIPLLPGAPLLITRNVSKPLGMNPFLI